MRLIRKELVLSLAFAMALFFAGCDQDNKDVAEKSDTEKAYLTTEIEVDEPIDDTEQLGAMDSGELEASEINALEHMRNEELLARDVYHALFELYHYPVFRNLSRSENWHANIMLFMLNKYELEDPAAGHEHGVFADPDFQALYDSLITLGQQSGTDALLVGATIEDMDIYDLQNAIATEVDNPDIVCAFENLMKGSRNHMRAFGRILAFGEATYEAHYITQAEYDAIMESEFEVGPAYCGCPMHEDLEEADTLALAGARTAEVMAFDLMQAFYNTYNYQVFKTTRNLESWQAHMLKRKLHFYGLTDPMSTHEPGVFEDTELQNTYDSLLQVGAVDGMTAVMVALEVQEASIYAYQEAMLTIESDNVNCTFLNLNRVSRNSIRTLSTVLQNSWNESYTPQYISLESYEEIISTGYEIGPVNCDEEG